MRLIGVTGGVATGKSTATELLAKELECPWCSCDPIVHGLLRSTPVIQAIAVEFPGTVSAAGAIDRSLLAQVVFGSDGARRRLEALLHPMVLDRVNSWIESHESGSAFGLIEVPLLYEVDFPLKRDVDLVVACSERTQIERLTRRDENSGRVGDRIAAQMPVPEKILRAGVVIWNDGSLGTLSRLVVLTARRIHQMMQ